jgi:hypothetical protein
MSDGVCTTMPVTMRCGEGIAEWLKIPANSLATCPHPALHSEHGTNACSRKRGSRVIRDGAIRSFASGGQALGGIQSSRTGAGST